MKRLKLLRDKKVNLDLAIAMLEKIADGRKRDPKPDAGTRSRRKREVQ
jgi:hypothetical protein